MPYYEYKAVPAPRQVPKVRGLKGNEARYAHGLTDLLNTWADAGWEFVRAETLPVETRSGLTGRRASAEHTLLIFRRELIEDDEDVYDDAPEAYAEPVQTPEELAQELQTQSVPAPQMPSLTARREAGPAQLRPVPGPERPRR